MTAPGLIGAESGPGSQSSQPNLITDRIRAFRAGAISPAKPMYLGLRPLVTAQLRTKPNAVMDEHYKPQELEQAARQHWLANKSSP